MVMFIVTGVKFNVELLKTILSPLLFVFYSNDLLLSTYPICGLWMIDYYCVTKSNTFGRGQSTVFILQCRQSLPLPFSYKEVAVILQ